MSGNAVRDSHVAMLLRMTADSKDLSLLVILLSLLFGRSPSEVECISRCYDRGNLI